VICVKKLFLILFVAILFSACATRERDGGFIQAFELSENAPEIIQIENEFLRLEFFTETAEIILTETATGNAWRSAPENIADDPHTAAVEKFNAQSLFVLDFERKTGAGRAYDAHRYSVRDGNTNLKHLPKIFWSFVLRWAICRKHFMCRTRFTKTDF